MRNVRNVLAALAAVVGFGFAQAGPILGQGTWETTLKGRDLNRDGVIDAYYDTALNLTWLDTATTYAASWDDAMQWAADLDVYGVKGWRLPTMVNTSDSCQFAPFLDGSEWRHMFFSTLGNGKSCSFSDPALQNTGPFIGLAVTWYWSSTENPNFPDAALDFLTAFGQGSSHDKSIGASTWAVHDGDVCRPNLGCFGGPGPFPAPEPNTLALAGLGLIAAWMARRRTPACPFMN